MARITYVKKAQQRYATVPVLDENGQPKKTPMISKRTGEQKVTKHGRPVFMAVTQADKTKPLPPLTCEACGKPIEVGTPYKHVTPKSGPYGGYQRNRHADCPGWKPWDLSNAWWARIAQVTDPALDGFEPETEDDVTSKASEIAEDIRGLAEESREAASNIEEGFGHPTSQSEEAEERANNLDSWANEIESVDVPELPEPEEEDCGQCNGSGHEDERFFVINADGSGDVFEDVPDGFETEDEAQQALDDMLALPVHADTNPDAFEIEGREENCSECDGTGQVTGEEPSEDQMNDWREEAVQALQGVLDNSPL